MTGTDGGKCFGYKLGPRWEGVRWPFTAPGLLLADFESADSLGSSWTVSNRAAAHNVLSSMEKIAELTARQEKLEAELARRQEEFLQLIQAAFQRYRQAAKACPQGKRQAQARSPTGTPASPASSLFPR